MEKACRDWRSITIIENEGNAQVSRNDVLAIDIGKNQIQGLRTKERIKPNKRGRPWKVSLSR